MDRFESFAGFISITLLTVACGDSDATGDESSESEIGTETTETSGDNEHTTTVTGETSTGASTTTGSTASSTANDSSANEDTVTEGDNGDGGDTPTCDSDPPLVLPHPADLTHLSEWANLDEYQRYTQGIWAIWWHADFDHTDDAHWLANELEDVRCRALSELAMREPPNPGMGHWYNVYIHHGENDPFPDHWANGQGTDRHGLPYLSLPNGAHLEPGNIAHEGFHVFQYDTDSPGFEYEGDSAWYTESSAQWYAAYRRPNDRNTFIEAGAIDGNPHLALWHSFDNHAEGDPTDWLFQVRQYGMHTLLYYLTEEAGINRDILTSGFFGGVTQSPQEYIYRKAGASELRAAFADWAAHNTADFDYLTREQVLRAREEVEAVADPNNLHPFIQELSDAGTAGANARPPEALAPRGWGYNVIKINNTQVASYHVAVSGDVEGSEGAANHLEARLVITGAGATRYREIEMNNGTDGQITAQLGDSDTHLFIIVAAVPEHFVGNQTYGYSYRIDRSLRIGSEN